MNLDLNQNEVSDLREALDAYTHGLMDELAHADQRQYQQMLRDKLARFEALAVRLEKTEPAEVHRFM